MKIIFALLCLTFLVSEIVAGPPNAEPQLRRSELPLYPPLARQARIAGTVKLSFVINTDGSVRKVQALSGHPMLKASAVANVESWRFRPGDGTGKPEATEFVFRLCGTGCRIKSQADGISGIISPH